MRAADVPASASGGTGRSAPALVARVLLIETVLVVGIAVGIAGARGAMRFLSALTAPGPLSAHEVTLTATRYPSQPWLDLSYQLVVILALLLPALLAVHLALRDSTRADLGLVVRRWSVAVLWGAGVAGAVGAAGLALYLASRAIGTSLEVRPTDLGSAWWVIPVLILAAAANAVLEEVVVVGYLLRRLDQLGVGPRRAALISAALRASYHLYQGLAGVLGNLVMGWLFARWFQRMRSVVPLIVAHWLIDVAAFVGYAVLADRVTWL